MSQRSTHGGKREGAGRKPKWPFFFKIDVGQACERLWRETMEKADQASRSEMFSEKSELAVYWRKAAQVPVAERKEWRDSEEGKLHHDDVEIELSALSPEQPENQPVPRIVQISRKPPRGSRKRITEAVAREFGILPQQVDNIWQQYRKFESE